MYALGRPKVQFRYVMYHHIMLPKGVVAVVDISMNRE